MYEMNRQQIRRAVLLLLLVSLPATLFYVSPIILIMGASEGIATGSMILFITFFILSLFLGRVWCGWLCPMGAFQEFCGGTQNHPVTGGRLNLIKYGVWGLWFIAVIAGFLSAGGIHAVNIFYSTDSGISLTEPTSYLVYFIIMCIIFLFAVVAGKRGFCHYLCPICVHFIIGRKIRNLFKWPALHLSGNAGNCTSCNRCLKACPMGLDVRSMVQENRMEETECILCASCADVCPKDAISYGFR
jgi:ferredoxin-type protein NapH